MKKAAMIALILMCAACIPAAARDMMASTEIYGSVAFGGLFSGYQKDLPDQTLAPVPDGYTALMVLLGIRHFFIQDLGIEGSVGGFGSTSATKINRTSVNVYDYTMFTLGLAARFPVALTSNSAVSFFAGAGATYPILSLGSDYTSLETSNGIIFPSVTPDLGWYGKLGIGYYFAREMFLDVTGYYVYLNSHFNGTGQRLDGTYLLLAVSVGVAF